MLAIQKIWAEPAEAEQIAQQVGGFVVRGIAEGPTGMTEAQAHALAAEMLRAGWPSVGVFRLNAIVEKGK